MKKIVILIGLVILLVGVMIRLGTKKTISKSEEGKTANQPTIVLTPTMTVTPTVKQLTAQDYQRLYGPCVNVSVLMYHHIQTNELAKDGGYSGLNVSPEEFRKQMEYLKTRGYNFILVDDIASYFNSGTAIPPKSVAITLDDAYEDNYTNAYPILKELGLKATIFTPSGLVNNPNYLNWEQIKEMNNSGVVRFANHTWSHHGSSGNTEVQDFEIKTADIQLTEHGLNTGKIFAYPYGNPSISAEAILQKYGYSIAFTTVQGTYQCKGLKYNLPRIRIGNGSLANYGL